MGPFEFVLGLGGLVIGWQMAKRNRKEPAKATPPSPKDLSDEELMVRIPAEKEMWWAARCESSRLEREFKRNANMEVLHAFKAAQTEEKRAWRAFDTMRDEAKRRGWPDL